MSTNGFYFSRTLALCVLAAAVSLTGCGSGGGGSSKAVFPGAVMVHGYGQNVGDFDEDGRTDAVYRQTFGPTNLFTVFGDSFAAIQEGLERYNETEFPPATARTSRGIIPTEVTDFDDVGDVDGDGHLDYIVSTDDSLGDARLLIMYGDGTGEFPQSVETITPGPTVEFLTGQFALADFNNDGLLDFVFPRFPASFATGMPDMIVLLNVDGRRFAAPATIPGATGNFGWSALDIDGDDNVDLVHGLDLAMLRGLGNGTFVSAGNAVVLGAQEAGSRILPLDLENDGDMDMLISVFNFILPQPDSRVEALRNDGTGVFTRQDTVPGEDVFGTLSTNTGDINNDGFADFVVNSGQFAPIARNVTTYLGQANGFFSEVDGGLFMPGATPVLVDLDGDGNLDVSAGVPDSNLFDQFDRVAQGRGDGTFGGEDRLVPELTSDDDWEGMSFVLPGDFDGDSDVDIAVGALDADFYNHISLFSNVDGLGEMMHTYDAQYDAVSLNEDRDTIVSDVNNDTRDDLVMAYDGAIVVHPGTLSGTFGAMNQSNVAYLSGGLYAARLNQDAFPDLVQLISNPIHSALIGYHFLVNDGSGNFVPSVNPGILSDFEFKTRVVVDDFNNDGLSDIADVVGNEIAVRFGSGNGMFGARMVIATLPDEIFSGQLLAADLDGDGSQDLYFNGPKTDLDLQPAYSATYINEGGGAFTTIATASSDRVWGPGVLVDIDLDGRPDEVTHSRAGSGLTGALSVRFGEGPGEFGDALLYPVRVGSVQNPFASGFGNIGFDLVDLNGDDYPDLVGEGVIRPGLDGWPVILFNQLGGARN